MPSFFADRFGVPKVLCGGAVSVVIFPVRHMQTLDLMAGPHQTQCCDCGIDSTGQGDYDTGFSGIGHAVHFIRGFEKP